LSRQTLVEVVEPRYEELFTLVQAELQRSGYENLIAAGVVLTGGSARMEGAVELAEEIFHMPVRLGLPHYVAGLSDVIRNPIYSTAVGLLLFGNENRSLNANMSLLAARRGLFARIKSWFQSFF
jgi:cell division protein FtsA